MKIWKMGTIWAHPFTKPTLPAWPPRGFELVDTSPHSSHPALLPWFLKDPPFPPFLRPGTPPSVYCNSSSTHLLNPGVAKFSAIGIFHARPVPPTPEVAARFKKLAILYLSPTTFLNVFGPKKPKVWNPMLPTSLGGLAGLLVHPSPHPAGSPHGPAPGRPSVRSGLPGWRPAGSRGQAHAGRAATPAPRHAAHRRRRSHPDPRRDRWGHAG